MKKSIDRVFDGVDSILAFCLGIFRDTPCAAFFSLLFCVDSRGDHGVLKQAFMPAGKVQAGSRGSGRDEFID